MNRFFAENRPAHPRRDWLERRSLVFVVLLLLTRAPFFGFDFLNVDEAVHLAGARELVDGTLYRTFVDNKPPFVHLFYALGGGSMFAVRVFAAFFLVLPVAYLAAACETNARRGTFAGALYLLASASFVAADTQAVNTELVLLPFIAFATRLCSQDTRLPSDEKPLRLLTIGAAIGLATLAKQPGIVFLVPAALGVGSLSVARRIRRSVWLVLGAAGVLGVTSLVFLAAGSHADYLEWVWLFNWQHVRPPLSIADAFTRFLAMGLPLVGAWSVLGFGAAFPVTGEDTEWRRFLLVALFVNLAPAFLGFRLFGHYFLPALFFLVLLATPRLFDLVERRPRLGFALIGAPALVFTCLNPWLYHPKSGVADVSFPVHEEVGTFLRQADCAGDLFVWGYAPQLYHFADRRPATRYVVPIEPITGYVSGNSAFERGETKPHDHVSAAHRAQLIADWDADPPAYVVDTSPSRFAHWDRFPPSDFPEFAARLARDYDREHEISGMVIHRRKTCRAP